MADLDKVIKSIEDCVFHKNDCVDCDYDGCVFEHGDCKRDLLADALELLKEQRKKEIKLIKKHTFSLKRTDEFSMRRLYEIICETLMDDGQLIISRTDDHEKVDFVWEIRDN